MNVLVTGASGFLGTHVTRALESRGHTVVLAGRQPIGSSEAREVHLDLSVPTTIPPALARAEPEAVIHCAAYGVDHRQQDPQQAVAVNVEGTLLLYLHARDLGVRRFVHIGTAFEYGDHASPISETTTPTPAGLYGASKAAGSLMLLERGRVLGQGPVVVRPFALYGPGEGPHKLVPQVVRAALRDEPLDLTECEEVRDFLPVMDAAWAIALIAELPDAVFPFGQAFNLCTGRGTQVKTFVRAATAAAGGRPDILRFGALTPRPDTALTVVGDSARWREFCQRTGLDTLLTHTPMEAVIKQMITEG